MFRNTKKYIYFSPSKLADTIKLPSGQNFRLTMLCKWPSKCLDSAWILPPMVLWWRWIFWWLPPNANSLALGDQAKQLTGNGKVIVFFIFCPLSSKSQTFAVRSCDTEIISVWTWCLMLVSPEKMIWVTGPLWDINREINWDVSPCHRYMSPLLFL